MNAAYVAELENYLDGLITQVFGELPDSSENWARKLDSEIQIFEKANNVIVERYDDDVYGGFYFYLNGEFTDSYELFDIDFILIDEILSELARFL